MARDRGCHAWMEWCAHELSYAAPQPVQPRDEADELRRQFMLSVRALSQLAERIERVEPTAVRTGLTRAA